MSNYAEPRQPEYKNNPYAQKAGVGIGLESFFAGFVYHNFNNAQDPALILWR